MRLGAEKSLQINQLIMIRKNKKTFGYGSDHETKHYRRPVVLKDFARSILHLTAPVRKVFQMLPKLSNAKF